MEKLIYLLGDTEPGTVPRARNDLREALLELGPRLGDAGAQQASFSVADLESAEKVDQFNTSGLIDAEVSLWIDSIDQRNKIETLLSPLSRRFAGYLVTESIPLSPSDQPPAPGARSRGVALVSTFPKPKQLDDETFFARWHGSHTPLSLEIHPLLQYIRNSVVRSMTPGAPPIRAIVSESIASIEIAADPDAFYRSARDRKRAVQDLLSFVDFERLSVVLMSHYTLSV